MHRVSIPFLESLALVLLLSSSCSLVLARSPVHRIQAAVAVSSATSASSQTVFGTTLFVYDYNDPCTGTPTTTLQIQNNVCFPVPFAPFNRTGSSARVNIVPTDNAFSLTVFTDNNCMYPGTYEGDLNYGAGSGQCITTDQPFTVVSPVTSSCSIKYYDSAPGCQNLMYTNGAVPGECEVDASPTGGAFLLAVSNNQFTLSTYFDKACSAPSGDDPIQGTTNTCTGYNIAVVCEELGAAETATSSPVPATTIPELAPSSFNDPSNLSLEIYPSTSTAGCVGASVSVPIVSGACMIAPYPFNQTGASMTVTVQPVNNDYEVIVYSKAGCTGQASTPAFGAGSGYCTTRLAFGAPFTVISPISADCTLQYYADTSCTTPVYAAGANIEVCSPSLDVSGGGASMLWVGPTTGQTDLQFYPDTACQSTSAGSFQSALGQCNPNSVPPMIITCNSAMNEIDLASSQKPSRQPAEAVFAPPLPPNSLLLVAYPFSTDGGCDGGGATVTAFGDSLCFAAPYPFNVSAPFMTAQVDPEDNAWAVQLYQDDACSTTAGRPIYGSESGECVTGVFKLPFTILSPVTSQCSLIYYSDDDCTKQASAGGATLNSCERTFSARGGSFMLSLQQDEMTYTLANYADDACQITGSTLTGQLGVCSQRLEVDCSMRETISSSRGSSLSNSKPQKLHNKLKPKTILHEDSFKTVHVSTPLFALMQYGGGGPQCQGTPQNTVPFVNGACIPSFPPFSQSGPNLVITADPNTNVFSVNVFGNGDADCQALPVFSNEGLGNGDCIDPQYTYNDVIYTVVSPLTAPCSITYYETGACSPNQILYTQGATVNACVPTPGIGASGTNMLTMSGDQYTLTSYTDDSCQYESHSITGQANTCDNIYSLRVTCPTQN